MMSPEIPLMYPPNYGALGKIKNDFILSNLKCVVFFFLFLACACGLCTYFWRGQLFAFFEMLQSFSRLFFNCLFLG